MRSYYKTGDDSAAPMLPSNSDGSRYLPAEVLIHIVCQEKNMFGPKVVWTEVCYASSDTCIDLNRNRVIDYADLSMATERRIWLQE